MRKILILMLVLLPVLAFAGPTNRTTVTGGIWANGAANLPGSPVAGTTYANSTMSSTTIQTGWPYSQIVNSANFNEIMRRLTSLSTLQEQWGILPHSTATTYTPNAVVIASDGLIYECILTNSGNDPTVSPTYWRKLHVSWADTLGGKSWSQTPGANQVPVLNASGGLNLGVDQVLINNASDSTVVGGQTYGSFSGALLTTIAVNATEASGTWKYIQNGPAYLMRLNRTNGQPEYASANSGTAGATITWGTYNKVWHAGNDGAGSGLDADKLQGKTWVSVASGTAGPISAGQEVCVDLRASGSHHFYQWSAYSTTGAVIERDGGHISSVNHRAWISSSNTGPDQLCFRNYEGGSHTYTYSVFAWE